MEEILKRLTPDEIAQLNEEFDALTLKDDFIFGETMAAYPDLCRRLIEIILDIKVKSIEYIDREKTLEERLDAKGVRLDVYVEEKGSGRSFDIEMQIVNHHDLEKRLRYYQGMMDLDKLKRGNKYEKLGETYIIFICLFDYFNLGRRKYTFREVCLEEPTLKLNDGSTKVVLNAPGLKGDVSDELNGFLDYLMGRPVASNEFFNDLNRAVAKVKTGVERRMDFMKLSMLRHDWEKDAREEERDRSNERFTLLTQKLIADGKTNEFEEIAKDKRRIETLCALYGIT